MQKKLLAVAVAGALAAPAAAWAQTSTVNIYGNITYEYGFVDQGRNQRTTDYADTPGGSAIGFRGEEKLGGGLSAWFQCETSADVRAIDQIGWCSRNSAVGFKGAFGNLHFGRWDTPFKRAMNQGTVGAEETGILGTSFLAFGGSGGADATGTGPDATNRQRWKRREAGLSYYETPVFGGFQGLFAFSSGNRAADVTPLEVSAGGVANSTPRVWSLAGTYTAGPLALGAGWERHSQFGAYSPVSLTSNLDDDGWGASASYTFAGRVKVGGTFLRRQWETAPGRELEKDTWTIGVDWAVAGPHSIQGQFVFADDSDGNSLAGIGGRGGAVAPRCTTSCPFPNPTGVERAVGATGAKQYSIAYTYAFSKRTTVKLGYVRVDNDANAVDRVGNSASLVGAGQAVDGAAFLIKHRF